MPPKRKRESEKVDLILVKEEPSLENMELGLIVKKQFESVKEEPTPVKEEPESQEYEVSIGTSIEVYNCPKMELEVEFSPVAQSDFTVGDSDTKPLKQESDKVDLMLKEVGTSNEIYNFPKMELEEEFSPVAQSNSTVADWLRLEMVCFEHKQLFQDANKDTAKTNPDCSRKSNSVSAMHKCYICLNTFTDESTMYSHLCVPKVKEMEEHKKLYVCELCNIRKFKDEESLNAHKIKSHINETKHSCQKCQMWFKCEFTLEDHNADVHGKVRDVKWDVK